MATSILETLGTVRSDGTLELDQRVTVPPGRVKVRVESMDPPATVTETLVEFVDRARQELLAGGHTFRTKEEIDAEINELRGEWDDPLENREDDGKSTANAG